MIHALNQYLAALMASLFLCSFGHSALASEENAPSEQIDVPEKPPKSEHRWSIGAFGGVGTYNDFGEILGGRVNLADSYIFGMTVGQEIYRYKNYIGLDWEGQVVKHFNLQDHWEFNILIAPRWHRFPWDRYLDTSFAFGNGLSYATDEPELEIIRNDETNRLLHYFYLEFDFMLPKQDHWSVFARIHHRSGVFGLFDGVHGGSNFFTSGVRYTF